MGKKQFNSRLDLETYKESKEFDNDMKLTVSIHSYDGGAKKLQISREGKNKIDGEWRFLRLGRLSRIEIEGLMPMLTKALDEM